MSLRFILTLVKYQAEHSSAHYYDKMGFAGPTSLHRRGKKQAQMKGERKGL
jgi:hypothetical protein